MGSSSLPRLYARERWGGGGLSVYHDAQPLHIDLPAETPLPAFKHAHITDDEMLASAVTHTSNHLLTHWSMLEEAAASASGSGSGKVNQTNYEVEEYRRNEIANVAHVWPGSGSPELFDADGNKKDISY